MHGEPGNIRSDNGPGFIATAVREWLPSSGVKTPYIEPGSPWGNAYVESFNGNLEDELLGREIFTSLLEAKVLIEQYRIDYNHERPHSSLGYQTPRSSQPHAAVGAVKARMPVPANFPQGAAGSCTSRVLSSQPMENSRQALR